MAASFRRSAKSCPLKSLSAVGERDQSFQHLPGEWAYTADMEALVLEVLEGADAGSQIPFGASMEIGNAPQADLRLTDEHVVARHARVTILGDGAQVEDLDGPYGTYVNGLPIHGVHALKPGDELRLGAAVLELRTAEQAAAGARAAKTPVMPQVGEVLVPVAEQDLAPVTEHAANVLAFLAEETEAAFVPAEAPAESREERYGALTSWTDTRVRHQLHVAAFGLLGVAGIAVLIAFT
jgi:pSer/pThr/pTyr-binding forkhead associated (FHA) protein